MVSFQALLSPNRERAIPNFDGDASKKRKWGDQQTEEGLFSKRSSSSSSREENTKTFSEIELNLETPLPLEWQRCLDIQSGQIHFYNTWTQKRTSRDPRRSPKPRSSPPPSHDIMGLDLELNLQSHAVNNHSPPKHDSNNKSGNPMKGFSDLFKDENKNSGGSLPRCPSWLASGGDQKEMVATVCTKCHMLVMLCKASPACPNCKFLHPPDQSPPRLFKQKLSLASQFQVVG